MSRRLASVAAFVLPLALYVANRAGWPAATAPETVGAAACVAALIVIKHQSNLRRLMAGTERRLGQPRETTA